MVLHVYLRDEALEVCARQKRKEGWKQRELLLVRVSEECEGCRIFIKKTKLKSM